MASNGGSKQLGRRYVLITPCRDEQHHLRAMVRTVLAQTVVPARWVIVDDGSTDQTPEILADLVRERIPIEVVTRSNRGDRSVGAGVIEAFYAGLSMVDLGEFDYICKMDADLELPARYFERLLEEMAAEPRLGNLSGKVYLRLESGHVVYERMGDENAIGAAKFYRVECFHSIGGFVRHAGWDGIDGHMCRLKGWIARSVDDEELRIIHRRQMGSSHRSIWHGRTRWGQLKWYQGSAWYYVLAIVIYRLPERPLVLGGIGILWGYLRSMFSGAPRFDYPGFRTHLRRFERTSLFCGKAAALTMYHSEVEGFRS